MSADATMPPAAGRGGFLASRTALAVAIAAYTTYTLGPFLWLATMSVRTTGEISADHYAWPRPFHWEQFRIAWVDSDFATYFWNSTIVVVAARSRW